MTGSSGEQDNQKIEKTRHIDVCLILFGVSLLSVLYGFFTRALRKKLDGPFGVALLEALAG